MKHLPGPPGVSPSRLFYQWAAIGLIGVALYFVWLAPSPIRANVAVDITGTPMAYLPVVLKQPTLTPTPSPTPPPTPTAFPGGYVLNGSFEIGDSQTNTGTANWLPWWLESPKPPDGSYNYAYKPNSFNQECLSTGAASVFIYTGNCSQRVLNNWDPWWAGVKQRAAAPAGQRVRLTAYGRAWASSVAFPAPSDPNVNVKMQVAIEPNGNCDQFASTVIWSAPIAPHDGWQAVSVDAQVGPAGQVCVILSTDYRGYSRFNLASFWDAASLVLAP
jgi:hypothetical protein